MLKIGAGFLFTETLLFHNMVIELPFVGILHNEIDFVIGLDNLFKILLRRARQCVDVSLDEEYGFHDSLGPRR